MHNGKTIRIERCGTCQFYNREEETTHNLHSDEPLHEDDYEAPCRRFPPVREYAGKLEDSSMQVLRDFYVGPIVQTTAWCGEWRPPKDLLPLPYPQHCSPEDVGALLLRLEALADPAQKPTPSYEDTDWRMLAGVSARVIKYLVDPNWHSEAAQE